MASDPKWTRRGRNCAAPSSKFRAVTGKRTYPPEPIQADAKGFNNKTKVPKTSRVSVLIGATLYREARIQGWLRCNSNNDSRPVMKWGVRSYKTRCQVKDVCGQNVSEGHRIMTKEQTKLLPSLQHPHPRARRFYTTSVDDGSLLISTHSYIHIHRDDKGLVMVWDRDTGCGLNV